MELGDESLRDYFTRHNPSHYSLLKGAARALEQFHNRKKSLFNVSPKLSSVE